jgi:hypothetical protein
VSSFAILSILPTLDLSEIKRAYFTAVAKSPPHVDPARFRRIRDAYEALAPLEARARAFLEAPVDATAAVASYKARYAGRLHELRNEALSRRHAAGRVRCFAEFAATTSLSEAIRAVQGARPLSHVPLARVDSPSAKPLRDGDLHG